MIWVTPLSALRQTIEASGARRVLSLLSDGTEYSPPAGLAECLHIRMNDISRPQPGLVAPSAEHVTAILEFGLQWERNRTPMVVHCLAGISRSTAAAYVIAAALQPERDEDELALELRRLAPSATPNPLIIAHADRLLGRKGRMCDAIRRIGRGEEAFEGTPFRFEIEG